jgi:integrase
MKSQKFRIIWARVEEGISKKTGVHSFRRTFSTRLAEQMIPYELMQRLLADEVDTQTEHYILFSPKMRERFYNYVELMVGDQEIEMVLE